MAVPVVVVQLLRSLSWVDLDSMHRRDLVPRRQEVVFDAPKGQGQHFVTYRSDIRSTEYVPFRASTLGNIANLSKTLDLFNNE